MPQHNRRLNGPVFMGPTAQINRLKQAWSTTMSHARSYTGSRSTPTYDNGVIYHLGEMGRLIAFNAKTGALDNDL